ncbi:MAG: hypothetical protein IKH65_10700 [Clostridia bacterium]|nr:hypothetical protein [Clostridia bacterium]
MGFLDPIYDPLYDYDGDGKLDSFEEEEMFFDYLLFSDFPEDENTNSDSFGDDFDVEFDPFEFDPLLDDISELDDEQIQELLDLGLIDKEDIESYSPDFFEDEDTDSESFDDGMNDEFDSFEFDPMFDEISETDDNQIYGLLGLDLTDEYDTES